MWPGRIMRGMTHVYIRTWLESSQCVTWYNGARHTFESFLSHKELTYITNMNLLCHVYEGVVARIYVITPCHAHAGEVGTELQEETSDIPHHTECPPESEGCYSILASGDATGTYTHTHVHTYTCTHIHMYIHIRVRRVLLYYRIWRCNRYLYTHAHIHTYTHTHIHTHCSRPFDVTRTRRHKGQKSAMTDLIWRCNGYPYTHTHIHTYTRTHMHTHTYTHTHTHTYTHTHTHIHTYTHTHTHLKTVWYYTYTRVRVRSLLVRDHAHTH